MIPYGRSSLEVPPLPGLRLFLPNTSAPERPEREVLRAALEAPVGGPTLRALARGRQSAVILISCRTRRTGSHLLVPLLLDVLREAGISSERVVVCTASGAHDNWRAEDEPLLLGEAAGRVMFRGHDCRDSAGHATVGTTSFGNEVRLSRLYLDADLKIATGRVNHHYFAGFSGGPKVVLPGVASLETIRANHRLTLLVEGRDVRLNPDARGGETASNPVHREIVEGMRMAPPDFSVCTVLNGRNEVTSAFAGETLAAHERAVAMVRDSDAPRTDAPVDLLVVSPGGAPYDGDMIQSLKGLINSCEILRPGGAAILVAECPEGVPAWLLESAAVSNERELVDRMLSGRLRLAHNPLWILRLRHRYHVVLVTGLPRETVHALGFHAAANLTQGIALAEGLCGPVRAAALVPYGNVTWSRLERPE